MCELLKCGLEQKEQWTAIENKRKVGASREERIGPYIRFSSQVHEYRWVCEKWVSRKGSVKYLN